MKVTSDLIDCVVGVILISGCLGKSAVQLTGHMLTDMFQHGLYCISPITVGLCGCLRFKYIAKCFISTIKNQPTITQLLQKLSIPSILHCSQLSNSYVIFVMTSFSENDRVGTSLMFKTNIEFPGFILPGGEYLLVE